MTYRIKDADRYKGCTIRLSHVCCPGLFIVTKENDDSFEDDCILVHPDDYFKTLLAFDYSVTEAAKIVGDHWLKRLGVITEYRCGNVKKNLAVKYRLLVGCESYDECGAGDFDALKRLYRSEQNKNVLNIVFADEVRNTDAVDALKYALQSMAYSTGVAYMPKFDELFDTSKMLASHKEAMQKIGVFVKGRWMTEAEKKAITRVSKPKKFLGYEW